MVIPGWSFMEFIDEAGNAVFCIWLKGQPEEAQAAIDSRILTMRGLSKEQWSPKWVSSYKGYDKLLELRIPHNKVQYRPLGFYGPGRMEFTLVAGAIERNSKIPRPTLNVAMERMALVIDERRWIREYNFDPAEPLEETPE